MLKFLFGNWSLERKCLLFLGVAILFSLLFAFFAVQFVAERLVMEATRQSARDGAIATIWLKHLATEESKIAKGEAAQGNLLGRTFNDSEMMRPAQVGMLQSRFEYEIFRINDGLEHQFLNAPIAKGEDYVRLVKISAKLAERDAILTDEANSRSKDGATSPPKPPPESEGAGAIGDESNRSTQAATSSDPEIRVPTVASLSNPTTHIFEEAGPIHGYYYYYHPIAFSPDCRACHKKLESSVDSVTTPSVDPFRVIRVKLPYSETRTWRIWSYSLLTSIGIGTMGLSLFFIHWVLKRLVINPLSELKLVSEEIAKGNTQIQFHADTGDEFSELSESFNRMLRHMTEAQDKLRSVNNELDLRVDDLASLNLQLFEANRLKGEFLANMSHELRTPLNSILGFSEVLQGIETLTDKQRRYVFNIQNSGRILLEMINDILDLAKVEAGKMEVRPSEFCVLVVLRAQCEIFRKQAEDKNIDIQIDSSQSEMPVFQDQAKFAQIITNLFSNAIKFTPEGGLVTIACDWFGSDDFTVSVADTGVGIAASDHEVIFEKFRQASGVTGVDGLTREHSGTGLGLSIVRELCRLLGGDITLSSQLGQGSTFRVVLPRKYKHEVAAEIPIGDFTGTNSSTQ